MAILSTLILRSSSLQLLLRVPSIPELRVLSVALEDLERQYRRILQAFRDRLSDRVMERYGVPLRTTEVDLEVAEHELVVVVGRSGCGKSTLLRLVAGIEPMSEGQIFIDGVALNGLNPVARLMFQSSALLPWKKCLAMWRSRRPL